MHFRFWLTVSCLWLTRPLIAQQYKLAYFGETISHYGIRAGWEQSLLPDTGLKTTPTAKHKLLFSLNLSVFRHPDNHIGIALSPEIGWRYTGKRGGILQAGLSGGLLRTIYEAKTYRSDTAGNLKKVLLAGQWGFLPGVYVGLGKDFSVAGKTPLAIYTNFHYLRQYPYNHHFLLRPALEAGIIFKR